MPNSYWLLFVARVRFIDKSGKWINSEVSGESKITCDAEELPDTISSEVHRLKGWYEREWSNITGKRATISITVDDVRALED
jgi:hypothetical protein